jgi:hypothetical protein
MEGAMAPPPDQRRAPSRPPQAPGPGQRRPPPRVPAPPRPPLPSRKPAEPLLQQRSFAALILALISLVGLLMANSDIRRGIVVLAVTLVIGGGGLWLSTTAMSRAKKAGTARPRLSVLATVVAVAGTGLSAIALLGFALFWPQISQYSKCMAGANTVIAQTACNKQLHNSLPTNVHVLGH